MQKRVQAIIKELSRDFDVSYEDIEHLIVNYYEEVRRVLGTGSFEKMEELPKAFIPCLGRFYPNTLKIKRVFYDADGNYTSRLQNYGNRWGNNSVQGNKPSGRKKNKTIQHRQATKAERLLARRELRRIQDKKSAEQARRKKQEKRKALLELLKVWRGDTSKYGKSNTKAARESRKLNLNKNTDGTRVEHTSSNTAQTSTQTHTG